MLSGDCPGFGQAESKHPYCHEVVWVVKGCFDSPSQKRAVLAQHDKPASSLACHRDSKASTTKARRHRGNERKRTFVPLRLCGSLPFDVLLQDAQIHDDEDARLARLFRRFFVNDALLHPCLLYTSDAADEEDSVDL